MSTNKYPPQSVTVVPGNAEDVAGSYYPLISY